MRPICWSERPRLCRLRSIPTSEPASVTSSPSSSQVIPRPMMIFQCQALHGRRSNLAGTLVSMLLVPLSTLGGRRVTTGCCQVCLRLFCRSRTPYNSYDNGNLLLDEIPVDCPFGIVMPPRVRRKISKFLRPDNSCPGADIRHCRSAFPARQVAERRGRVTSRMLAAPRSTSPKEKIV